MEWSEAVAVEGHESPDDDIKAIAKASAEDVARVARQYLTFNEAITAVLTPQASGKPISSSSLRWPGVPGLQADSRGGASRLGREGA